MPPETTVWPIEPHTNGKHLVLRHYLNAWLPIMLRSNERVLYIDAFAGPGEYEGGELGSPLIAVNSFINHSRVSDAKGSIAFEFIEANIDRYRHLQSVMARQVTHLPSNATWEAHNGTFDDRMTKVLNQLDIQRQSLAPALVMIDPFGVSDTPMSTVQRILQNPKAEICLTFMYDTVKRFATASHYDDALTGLFGSEKWKEGVDIKDENGKFAFFVDLYKSGLKEAGAKQLLHFAIGREDRRNYYAIIYATKSTKGSDVMKKAMWKVAPNGDYRFIGGNLNQIAFGEGIVDYNQLQRQLVDRFHGKGWVHMAEIEDFVMSDATLFHSGHLKSKALTPMGKAHVIKVSRRAGNTGFATDGTKVSFSEKTANEARLF